MPTLREKLVIRWQFEQYKQRRLGSSPDSFAHIVYNILKTKLSVFDIAQPLRFGYRRRIDTKLIGRLAKPKCYIPSAIGIRKIRLSDYKDLEEQLWKNSSESSRKLNIFDILTLITNEKFFDCNWMFNRDKWK